MESWGTGPFENDDALDWVEELEEATDLSLIVETVRAASEAGEGGLDTGTGKRALAAAETVARMLGRPGRDLPEEVEVWAKMNPLWVSDGLVEKCRRLAQHALAEGSGLDRRWRETDDHESWRQATEDLLSRLAQ